MAEIFENGLRDKYIVTRKETGEKCDGTFVLRPITDSAAYLACMFYSYLTHNPRLGRQIREWLQVMKEQQLEDEKL